MSRTLVGSCETPYRKTILLPASHYESELADAQTCVEHIFCKDLGGGVIAAYGSYAVFLLFTYKDFSGKPACFHQMIRQTFSLLFEDGVPDADAFEIQFTPQAAARPKGAHAIEWAVEITAAAGVSFYKETMPAETLIPAAAEKPEQDAPPPPDGETKATPAASLPAHAPEKNSPKPTEDHAPETPPDKDAEPKKPETGGRFWRIRPDASVSPEKLLEMEEAHRSTFMEEST
ncbi:hypothetical protein [Ethanoligenens harbinense]|uniref:Uncharacterized protein n=1 Tax=Ethanoligenens harbinense (strain DSM 18485 / JCM 12961 / CGMCC 1.5033 / YUAN-3) TaxID=663278 RepID=E6U8W1_ETHHY|nr:hypothetical protein [Ethanoligenens harbinense]ADU27196.1 hypothetical protein Ethha_1661 [Ethanoligenens harbinense YUAN-3]AVQ96265.1 hypothetical protein CXQ68_08525 [Ethanoligenens harbinense YUAN-3]AYF38924.1 hypothetical protein CXP51_08395 [Ethanoligenens harbinense]AYF41675.1 hypothetical protein CN246_08540 [Ethanoligenens harbinense]QCN92506.1 hypothetical protein DRA42_08550 [Ethanoligenens harbinense]